MIGRNSQLNIWPEALKAIAMASAIHNIEGPSIIPYPNLSDLKDGAGGIDAELADRVAQIRAAYNETCSLPCWWGDTITTSTLPPGGWMYRYTFAERGDLVRVTIAWWAETDPFCCYSQLGTDLDLSVITIINPQIVAESSSRWNNYEMVEFVAPETNWYAISIYRQLDLDPEPINWVGTAFVRLHLPNHEYLPIVLKDSVSSPCESLPTATPTIISSLPTPTTISPLPTPTDTPGPTTDWTFSGEVTDLGTSQPVSCADATLYRQQGNTWQAVDSITTGSDGRFTLHYAGSSDSGRFLLLMQYPSGHVPAYVQPGPHFVVVNGQMLMSVEALPPGSYDGHHFYGLRQPNLTPIPGTPTVPLLPTVIPPVTLTP